MTARAPSNPWSIAVETIPERGLEIDLAAAPETRAEIAARLELVALDGLTLAGRLVRRGTGAYRLEGRLAADAVQSCVVTLEPVPARIEEAVDVVFRADAEAGRGDSAEDDEHGVLALEDVEPIEQGRIDLARLAYETLAAALDPYPRKPGAAFVAPAEAGPPQSAAARPDNPFAVLAKLKRDG